MSIKELKKLQAELLLLTKPVLGEDLVLSTSVGQEAISSMLLREEDAQ